jgi:hypothetical protein
VAACGAEKQTLVDDLGRRVTAPRHPDRNLARTVGDLRDKVEALERLCYPEFVTSPRTV